MKLRLTLLDPQHVDARVDVLIEAPSGTPLSAVGPDLRAALGRGEDHPGAPPVFACNRRPLDESQPLGLPPLLQGAVLTLSTEPSRYPTESPPAALLEAHVIAGPDAGAVVPLPPGRHPIGRRPGFPIGLIDPDVSRQHAELQVSADRIELRDTGSTNGTWLRAQKLGRAPELVHLEDRIGIGRSVITVRGPGRAPAAATVDGAGHLRINRRPHLLPPRAQPQIRFPAAPPDRTALRVPWPAMLLPLLVAVPMAVFWRQPALLLFTLMTPLMMVGQYLADRRSGRRESARQWARHHAVTAQRQHDLERALRADAAHLDRSRADLARLLVTAITPTDELWPRSAADIDFLLLRIGRGPEPAAITVHRPSPVESGEPPGGEPERCRHADVPLAVDLAAAGVLGVCGSRRAVLGLARSLVGQIAVLHSPQQVRLSVLTASPEHRPDWRWVTWLPHHESGVEPAAPGPDDGPVRRVIVLDGAHGLRGRPAVAALLNRAVRDGGPGVGSTAGDGGGSGSDRRAGVPLVLCLDRSEQDLPVECRATVVLEPDEGPRTAGGESSATLDGTGSTTGRPGSAVLHRQSAEPSGFVPDLAGERWAERLSRGLAPLRDATPTAGQGLPITIGLLDLLAEVDQVRATESDDLARHWQRGENLRPSATLGVTGSGAFRIDLRRDGPHLLVGGTTGAGKSELLQTLVAALAVDSGPDAMSFLLVDYKGGAAFRACAALPHVGGVITDLDPALARRALASLSAELRRRERLLHSVGAVDVDEYRSARTGRPDRPTMPRLVVVVDEFRVLAEELPEFVSGLVRTATVGRSLGVHLVLATQRPTGIVSAEIAANVNLRIALRVRDGSDSRDLIDDPSASRLRADRPGRALARSGTEPLVTFQTARISGHDRRDGPWPTTVRRLDLDPDRPDRVDVTVEAEIADRRPGTGISDLQALTRAAHTAATSLGLPPVAAPWLPPLPPEVRLDDLIQRYRADSCPRPALPFALIDRPDEQRQAAFTWALDGTHLAVAGGPRSGRSTTLRTIAQVAGVVAALGELHLYVIDGAGSLAALRSQPLVEAVIAVHDNERVDRLLRLLTAEIDARQSLSHGPSIVLLIDGWEALTSHWSTVDHGRPLDQLTAVLRDGPAVGVFAALSGGRNLLTGAVSTLLTERVVLRFADPADTVLAGVPVSRRPSTPTAGRGLALGPGLAEAAEIQVAVGAPIEATGPGPEPGRPAANGHVGIHLPVAPDRPGPGPGLSSSVSPGPAPSDRRGRAPVSQSSWQIPELPRRLEHDRLIAAWRRENAVPAFAVTAESTAPSPITPGRCRVPIGIGGDEARVLSLDLDAGPITLVVGPAGSGRTSALRCIAAGMQHLGEPTLWVSLGGPPRGLSEEVPEEPLEPGGAGRSAVALDAALTARPTATVLVDDAQTAGISGTLPDDVGDRLAARAGTGRLVIATSAAELLGAYRGLLSLARTARTGLLLDPGGPNDAEVFGLRPVRRPAGPAGRALLVQNGRAVGVQLALPPPRRDEPAVGSRTRSTAHPWSDEKVEA